MSTELQQLTERLLKKKAFRDSYNRVMTDVVYRVGRMVQEARVARGLTQTRLAQKIGTKQSSIARLENGNANISLGFLNKVAKALNTRLLSPRFESLKEVEDEHDKRVCQNLKPRVEMTVKAEDFTDKTGNASDVMLTRISIPMVISSKSN